METTFASAAIHEAALNGTGPFFSWLQRVQECGGDALLRRFALELLRSPVPSNGPMPAELLDRLATFIEDPELGSPALRPWLASDAYVWREVTKLAFEWGGAHRTGDRLIQQVAIVTSFLTCGHNPEPAVRAACERLPQLSDELWITNNDRLATKSDT